MRTERSQGNPKKFLRDPWRSLWGPMRSLGGKMRSLGGPMRSPGGPVRSLRYPRWSRMNTFEKFASKGVNILG